MKKKYYYKLIRDLIPKKIVTRGEKYEAYRLGKKEFEKELLLKAGEEAGALAEAKTKEEIISELADVIAVLEEIKKFKKISGKEVRNAIRDNMKKKGGFEKRLFLVWSSDAGYKTNERRGKKPRKG